MELLYKRVRLKSQNKVGTRKDKFSANSSQKISLVKMEVLNQNLGF